jgi:hypothetical protein
MKTIRISNKLYRAKQCGKYPSGENKYLFQFKPLLFGFIPLWWDSYTGEYSLGYIENYLSTELSNYTGEIADLNIKIGNNKKP